MTQQKVIIVSGGSRGLGSAVVGRLLAAGHSVATFSRRGSEITDQWNAEAALRERFHFESVDITNAEEIQRFVTATHQRFGRIDALINNAAIAGDGVLALTDDDSINQMIDVNLTATIRLTRECARLMLLRNSGWIINITSVAAQRGVAGISVYSATKAGLLGLTRSLARELGPKGIRVNAIAPGYLETEMSQGLTETQRGKIVRQTPLGRLGTVDDVAPWVEFLLSDAASYMTGQTLTIDGGASV